METKQFNPVEEVQNTLEDSVRVLSPLFRRLYRNEAVDMMKDHMKRAVIQKSLIIYRRLGFK